jgi:hypothetical protein
LIVVLSVSKGTKDMPRTCNDHNGSINVPARDIFSETRSPRGKFDSQSIGIKPN